MPDELPQSVTHRRSPRFRHLLKRLGLLLLLLLSAGTAITLAARHYLNADKLKQIVIQRVERTWPRKLELGSLSFHLFRGFTLQNVRLYATKDSTDLFPLRHLSIQTVTLRYSLADLFKRRLIIREMVFEQPDVEIFVDMADTTAIDLAALLNTDLPISFALQTLRFTDAKLCVVLADSQYRQTVHIDRAHLYIDEMNLPQSGWARHDSLLSGRFRLVCENTTLKMDYLNKPSRELFALESAFNLDSRISVNSFRDVRLNIVLQMAHTKLALNDRHLYLPAALTVGWSASIDAKQASSHMETFFEVDKNRWLTADIQLDSLTRQPHLRLEIKQGQIPLRQAVDLAQQLVPDSLLAIALQPHINSAFVFDGTLVEGALPYANRSGDLRFKVNGRLPKTSLQARPNGWSMMGAGFAFKVEGHSDGRSLSFIELVASAGMDSLIVDLNDSTSLSTGKGQVLFSGKLNGRLLPEKARLSFHINHCLGGEADGQMELQGSQSLAQLQGQGHWALRQVPLQLLSNLPIDGQWSLENHFTLRTLKHLRADWQLTTTPWRLAGEEEPITLPTIRLTGQALARTDTTWRQVQVDSMSLRLNDVLQAFASAAIDLGEQRIKINPCVVDLDHAALLQQVPAVWRERYQDLQMSGGSRLQLEVDATTSAAGLVYQVTGALSNHNTSVYDLERLFSLGGIHLESRFQLNSTSGVEATLAVLLDSLASAEYGMPSYLNNRFTVQLHSLDRQQWTIRQGHLTIPDVRTEMDFHGVVDPARVQAVVKLHQDIPDSFRFRGMVLKGRAESSLSINADTSSMDLLATIRAQGVSVSLPGLLSVRNLNADVRAHQQYDFHAGGLLSSQAFKIATPTNTFLDYLLYNGYYRDRQPNFSRITIEELDIMSYVLQQVQLELLLEEGRIEIPLFSAILLGGNVGGRMALDLASGNLAAASYKVNAHFANINSNLLTRYITIPKEDGVINGNLEFRGNGLDPEDQIVLDGYFYITKIGPKAADNLLNYLDPEAKDSGIRTSRMLIRYGFKPRLLSFDFRHLHLYPVIEFAKPWYLPQGLDRIELNRIPFQFFLERMKARADWQGAMN